MAEYENIIALTNKMEDKDFVCFHEKTEHYILVVFQSPILFSYDTVNWFPVNKNSLVLYTPGRLQAYKSNDNYFLNSFSIFDADPSAFDGYAFPMNKPFSIPQSAIDEIVILLDGISFIRNTEYFPEKRAQLPDVLRHVFETIAEGYQKGGENLTALLYSLREDILSDPKNNSVSAVAEKAGYNESYFCKLYRKQFGISPGQERQQQIVRMIKKYLESTDLTLESIAELCGISSLPFMIKIFKRSENMTPHQYRLQALRRSSDSNS